MKPRRLTEAYEFLPGKFLPRLVYGSGQARAFLLCLEAGQGLAPRADSEEMVCYVIEGRAKLTIGGESFEVSGGDFAGAAPGEVRGIEGEERCVVLWVHVSAGRSDDGAC
jgi:quercetin dioxygenase-like cupin family protein